MADTPLRWPHELADGTIRKTPPKTVVELSFGSLLSTRMTSLLVLECPIDILKLEKLQLTHAHERPVLLTHAMTP